MRLVKFGAALFKGRWVQGEALAGLGGAQWVQGEALAGLGGAQWVQGEALAGLGGAQLFTLIMLNGFLQLIYYHNDPHA